MCGKHELSSNIERAHMKKFSKTRLSQNTYVLASFVLLESYGHD